MSKIRNNKKTFKVSYTHAGMSYDTFATGQTRGSAVGKFAKYHEWDSIESFEELAMHVFNRPQKGEVLHHIKKELKK